MAFPEKKQELELIIGKCNSDNILLCEIHFKENSVFKLSNYDIERNDRPMEAGGRTGEDTAICIKRTVPYFNKQIPNVLEVEATAITVKFKGKPRIAVTVCYQSPRHKLEKQDLFSITNNSNLAIIAGYLNAKDRNSSCRNTNTKGKKLESFARKNDLEIVASPTFTRTSTLGTQDILGMALLKSIPYTYRIEIIEESPSDYKITTRS